MKEKAKKRIGIRDLVIGGRYSHHNGLWIREIDAIEGDIVYWSDEIGSGRCKRATFLASCTALAPGFADGETAQATAPKVENDSEPDKRGAHGDSTSKGGASSKMNKKTKKQKKFPGLKDLDVASRAELEKELEGHFFGGFSLRDEANAIAAWAFRNGPIEDLHAGEYSELLENDKLSRITDAEMKALMIYASERIAALLKKKEDDPEEYYTLVKGYGFFYCSGWDRGSISSD